jgi:nitrogen fixation protein FixH
MSRRTDRSNRRAPGSGRDRWIPWAFVALFCVVLIPNGVLIWVAFASWTGVDAENTRSYERGLNYNDRLAEVAAQRALGWASEFAYERLGPERARLDFALSNAEGEPLRAAAVVADVVRPTHQGHDFAVALPPVGPGTYAAEVAFPLPGQWEVRLEARHPDGTYRRTERIFLR